MEVSKLWTGLSILGGGFVVVVSGAGLLISSTYARETVNWTIQGRGQDLANLLVVVPMLFISAYLVDKGSLRAFFLWLSALIYLILTAKFLSEIRD